MSATTEELLLQIINTENLIQEKASQGQDVTQLQEQLLFLRQKFESLNETLKKDASILKG